MMIYIIQKYLNSYNPCTMKHIFFLFFLIFSPITAQVVETWNDGDFSSTPLWQGDVHKFSINTAASTLQLNAPAAASQAYITTSSKAINNATWEFSVHLDFNPSSSNYAIIYLASNQVSFNNNMEGYYVMIGNTQDEVSLYKQTSENKIKIIDGTDKILDSSPTSVWVRVLRDDKGNWQLYTKTESENYQLEGEAFNNDIVASSYFGIYCNYTSTRSNKFSFGPIHISGSAYLDTEKPQVTSHHLIAGNKFEIQFSEKIDISSIRLKDFSLLNQSYSIAKIKINNPSTITIQFEDFLNDTKLGQLFIKNIKDTIGNTIRDTTLTYRFERIKITNATVPVSDQLQLTFNKNIDNATLNTASALGELNFDAVTLKNDSTLLFIADSSFITDRTYQLHISGIQAEFGDMLKDTSIHITYRRPQRYDIVFSEFMLDPTPSVGLYNSEYIEIYNRREYPINLGGMQIVINDKESYLPAYELPGNSYVLIIDDHEEQNWPKDLPIIKIQDLPTLNNNKGTLVLYYANKLVSDVFQYPLVMDDAGFKSEGGWSLERIDTNNHQPEFNWEYATNLDGGTPGTENSVTNFNPDIISPYLKYISYLSPNSFEWVFSESLKIPDNFDLSAISIKGATITNLTWEPIFLKSVQISFANNLPTGHTFTANILSSISDFSDNQLSSNRALRLGVPEEIDSFDVIINEVLFNPIPTGVDFVELYNRSNKILNQSDIYLSSFKDMVLDELEPVDDKNQLLFPNDYLVITEDSLILSELNSSAKNEFINQSHLPSLNDDLGNIAVTKKTGQLIDYFEYTNDMHFELLRDQEGVSLERISPHSTTNSIHNWQSASKASGYATPTLQNSQYIENALRTDLQWLSLDKKEFSPNADGTDDNLLINYKLDETGWSGSVKIYNRYGIVIKTLAHNELLGTQGFFTWDGTTDHNDRAPLGIYIIYGDFFSSNGKTKQEKMTVVLTAGSKQH